MKPIIFRKWVKGAGLYKGRPRISLRTQLTAVLEVFGRIIMQIQTGIYTWPWHMRKLPSISFFSAGVLENQLCLWLTSLQLRPFSVEILVSYRKHHRLILHDVKGKRVALPSIPRYYLWRHGMSWIQGKRGAGANRVRFRCTLH